MTGYILAAIHPPMATRAILKSLGLPTRAPPIAPAQPVATPWTLTESAADFHVAEYRVRRSA